MRSRTAYAASAGLGVLAGVAHAVNVDRRRRHVPNRRGMPRLSARTRVHAATHVLRGRGLMYRVRMSEGGVTIGPTTRLHVIGCRFDGGGLRGVRDDV